MTNSSVSIGWSPRRIIIGFAVVQLLVLLAVANGPTGDEGIYAWIGMRQAETFPSVIGADSMNGSPWLWPWLAGPLFRIGGFTAMRLLAIGLATGAIWLVTDATRQYFGDDARDWSLLFLVLNGPLFALAHLGVYDLPALAAASAAVWCTARYSTGGGIPWLFGAAIATALAVIAKYAYVFIAPAIAGLILAGAGRRWREPLLFTTLVIAIVVAHNVAVLGTVLPVSYPAYQAATPPVARPLVAAEQAYFALPLAIAVAGALIARRRRASSGGATTGVPDGTLAEASFIWALLIWPAFHILVGSAQAGHKHVVAGAMIAAPLIGRTLATFRPSRLAIAGLGLWGVLQWATLEYSWTNARPTVDFLVRNVQPGQKVRSNAGTFRFLAPLHRAHADHDFAELTGSFASADADWIVWEDPPGPAVPGWVERARSAGYREVLHSRSIHIGADDIRPFGIHQVESRLFQRIPVSPSP